MPLHRFRIAGLEVDAGARRITTGQGEVQVEPKVFDLLLHLSGHPGRAIGQDELLEAVWGRSVASDTVVAQAIHKLRRVFREHGNQPQPLVTVRGIGYRLDAAPQVISNAPEATPRLQPDWRLALASLVLLAGLLAWWQSWRGSQASAPRVALLSLENATGQTDMDWAQGGIGGMLREQLQRRGIDVVSPNELQGLRQESDGADDLVSIATGVAGAAHVYRPRLVAHPDGYRLELLDQAGGGDTLSLTGSLPASLSLAMAGLLAEKLDAPLRPPAGGLGRDGPFLDEAYARAYYHQQAGDFDEARNLYNYILREMPDAHWARFHLSVTLRMIGEMDASRDHLDQLLSTSLEDPWLAAAVRTSLGHVHWYAGDLEKAERLYLDARETFATHRMPVGEASALGNLGMIAFSRGRFERGRDFAQQALEIYGRQGNQVKYGQLLHNIGYSYYDEGRADRAVEILESTLSLRERLGLSDQAANTRSVLAEIAIEQGRLREGALLLDQALATFERTGNERGRGNVLADLASVALRRGHYRRAHDLALESLALARSRDEAASMADAALTLGRSLHALGDWFGAEENYLEASRIWSRMTHRTGQLVCLGERIRLAFDRDRPELANTLMADYARQVEGLDDNRFHRDYQALEIRQRLARGELSGIEAAIGNTLDGLDERDFVRAELAVELGDALRAIDPEHPALGILLAIARDWAPRYYPAARLLYTHARDADQCRQALNALDQLRGADWPVDLPPSPVCGAG